MSNGEKFTVSSIGIINENGIPTYVKTPIVQNTKNYIGYTTVFKGEIQELGISPLFIDGTPVPNYVPNAEIQYIGAYAINGLDLKVNNITITNNSTSTAVVDLIAYNITYSPEIPYVAPVLLKRIVIPSETTEVYKSDYLNITLKNNVAQTESLPYYIFGYGLAVAFPNSV
ncbi:hypothetical protein, partial [Mycobacterium sp.]|uniref:hypothetical protein n=1 Tax=Mycobacterium sp. TaxID=1785 RepID=UPI0031E41869